MTQRARGTSVCLKRGRANVNEPSAPVLALGSQFATMQRARAISVCSKREQANGNEPSAPVLALGSQFAMMQRARAIRRERCQNKHNKQVLLHWINNPLLTKVRVPGCRQYTCNIISSWLTSKEHIENSAKLNFTEQNETHKLRDKSTKIIGIGDAVDFW
jgi:hypothetical protein